MKPACGSQLESVWPHGLVRKRDPTRKGEGKYERRRTEGTESVAVQVKMIHPIWRIQSDPSSFHCHVKATGDWTWSQATCYDVTYVWPSPRCLHIFPIWWWPATSAVISYRVRNASDWCQIMVKSLRCMRTMFCRDPSLNTIKFNRLRALHRPPAEKDLKK